VVGPCPLVLNDGGHPRSHHPNLITVGETHGELKYGLSYTLVVELLYPAGEQPLR
jgi:hypothetical protein